MDNEKGVDEYTLKVGRVLHDLQEDSGVSFRELASRTGLSLSTIQRILNPGRNMKLTANHVRLVALALDTTPGAIFDQADALGE